MQPSEVRRAPRFKVGLRVQIAGFDPEPVLREGDVSASGLYLDVTRDVGPVGSMQRLTLSTEEGREAVVLLCRIVRVAVVEDFWKGRSVAGVAFQFLFAEETVGEAVRTIPLSESAAVQRLLRAVVEHETSRNQLEVQNWRGTMRTRTGEQVAALSGLSLRGMAIETDYAVSAGETIRVEMPGRNLDSRLAFDGHVVECDPVRSKGGRAARYRVVVQFGALATPEAPTVTGDTMDNAFESLLHAFTSAPPAVEDAHAHHLAGALSRISVVSVLTLCQIERLTGVLKLQSGTSKVRAFLRDGELVDAVIDGRDVEPRGALSEVIGWTDGTFEMVFEPVTRPNRLGVSSTALLIDLTRQLDEAAHGSQST